MKIVAFAIIALSAFVGCAGAQPRPSAVPMPTMLDATLADVDVQGLPRLTAIAPDWLVKAAITSGASHDSYVQFLRSDDAFTASSSTSPGGLDSAHIILIALLVLESDRAVGRCDRDCQNAIVRGYNLYALWSFLDASETFGRVLALSRWDANLAPEQRAQLADFFCRFVRESGQRCAAETVRLVRGYRRSEEATTALKNLAVVKAWAGEYALAVRLYDEVLARKGDKATDDERVAAARVAYQAGDFERGRAFLGPTTTLTAEAVAELWHMEALAREAKALEHASAYGDRLRRDQLDFELDRFAAVRAQSPALIAESPQDARPYYYLARAAFSTFALSEADAIIRGAGPEHRDVDFYRFALGSSFNVLMSQSIQADSGDTFTTRFTADLPRLRALNAVYATLEPARAEWIAIATDFAEVSLAAEAPRSPRASHADAWSLRPLT